MQPKPVIIAFEKTQEKPMDDFLKLFIGERFYVFVKLGAKYIPNYTSDSSKKRMARIR